MALEIEYKGQRRVVDSTELFRLAMKGEISPTTRLWLNGSESVCGKVRGIVFGNGQTASAPQGTPAPSPRVSTPYLDYMIGGGSTPYVICYLNPGNAVYSGAGGRVWAKGPIRFDTKARGGFMASFGRWLSGETFFMSRYVAQGPAEIAFSTPLPGSITARVLRDGESIICQQGSFLAASMSVSLQVHYQERIGVGLFGGEGFVMQRITGPGVVFLELDGGAYEYILQPGERLVCDTGALAWMDESCKMTVQAVSGLNNILFGGEGFFDTIITGPGRVTLQSMSIQTTAKTLAPIIGSLLPNRR